MLTEEMVKQYAVQMGADLCGIGDLARFDGAPPEMDARYIFPEAKSIIGLGFRIPRGVIRGQEQGTSFYQYPSTSYAGINEIFAPAVLYELGRFLEDHGYEAAVYRNTGSRGVLSDATGQRKIEVSIEDEIKLSSVVEKAGIKRPEFAHRKAPRVGSVAPDVSFHFRIAAYICGLGEIGWSKMFLTPEFGPMQRFAFILTDAPLKPDPLYSGEPLCKQCKLCVELCPGNAISKTESISITIEGKKVEWGKLDEWQCFCHYMGASQSVNPFLPEDVYDNLSEHLKNVTTGKEKADEEDFKTLSEIFLPYHPSNHGYKIPKCGGCLRACVHMLEKNGTLKGKFNTQLRKGKPWKIK